MLTDNYADIFADGCYIDKWNVSWLHLSTSIHAENKCLNVCRSYHPQTVDSMDLHGVLTTLVGQESKDQVANTAFVARVLMKIVPEPFLHHPQVPRDVAKLDASRSAFVEDPTYEVLRKRIFGSWTSLRGLQFLPNPSVKRSTRPQQLPPVLQRFLTKYSNVVNRI